MEWVILIHNNIINFTLPQNCSTFSFVTKYRVLMITFHMNQTPWKLNKYCQRQSVKDFAGSETLARDLVYVY